MLHFKMYIKLNANTSLTLSDISVLLPIANALLAYQYLKDLKLLIPEHSHEALDV